MPGLGSRFISRLPAMRFRALAGFLNGSRTCSTTSLRFARAARDMRSTRFFLFAMPFSFCSFDSCLTFRCVADWLAVGWLVPVEPNQTRAVSDSRRAREGFTMHGARQSGCEWRSGVCTLWSRGLVTPSWREWRVVHTCHLRISPTSVYNWPPRLVLSSRYMANKRSMYKERRCLCGVRCRVCGQGSVRRGGQSQGRSANLQIGVWVADVSPVASRRGAGARPTIIMPSRLSGCVDRLCSEARPIGRLFAADECFVFRCIYSSPMILGRSCEANPAWACERNACATRCPAYVQGWLAAEAESR